MKINKKFKFSKMKMSYNSKKTCKIKLKQIKIKI